MKSGDWLLTALAAALVLGLAWRYWWGGEGRDVLVRSDGRPFARLDLGVPQRLDVPGPLGTTVIEVAAGRVRVARDPGPRQLCVAQGWLSRAGQTAVCLPNRVSVEIQGGSGHDTLGY